MKKNLQKVAFAVLSLIIGNEALAQINYSESFDSSANGWTGNFSHTSVVPCNGDGSLRANIWFDDWDYYPIDGYTVSPSVGVSNGNPITVNYSYKVLDYFYTGDPVAAYSQEWALKLYYRTSTTGTWNLVDTLLPSAHSPSLDCTTFTSTFTAPAGSPVYLRLYAEIDYYSYDDVYIYIDDVSVTQAPLENCTGTPSATNILSVKDTICLNETTVLSFGSPYLNSGLTYQWQVSQDGGITFTDIPGATEVTYTVSQTQTSSYRAVVTCTESNLSVTNSPITINSTGICYCPVNFSTGIEPITLVDFEDIHKVTSASTTGNVAYEDFTTSEPVPVLIKGESYPIALEGNTNGPTFINYFTVFIDWNQNGILDDEGEVYEIGSIQGSSGTDGQQATGSIEVPDVATTLTGTTRMRVVKKFSSTGSACNTGGYGQAEDYTVNVQDAMSAPDFQGSSFAYYPNPVNDILNLSHSSNIENIMVYNILGQQVMEKSIKSNQVQLNLSGLSKGTYLLKAFTEGETKTIKIIKQ